MGKLPPKIRLREDSKQRNFPLSKREVTQTNMGCYSTVKVFGVGARGGEGIGKGEGKVRWAGGNEASPVPNNKKNCFPKLLGKSNYKDFSIALVDMTT